MTRYGADAGDVPAHTIGLGYDDATLNAVEAAEEGFAARAAAPDEPRGTPET
jgi:hypothetical protein